MHTGPTGEDDTASPESVIAEPVEILERVSDAFYALDDEWRFRYVNERAEEFLDRPEGELLGRSVWDEFPGTTENRLWDEYHGAMEAQEPTSFELYYDPLDSWFELNVYPSETGLSVYFRDVTEEKERERRLVESQRRYRTLVDNFPNGAVVLFDRDLRFLVTGGDVDELDAVQFERSDSFDTDALVGETLSDVVNPALVEQIEPNYRAALDGETRTFLLTFGDKVQHVRTVPVRDEEGNVLAGLSISQDVTERFEKQRELESRSHQQEVVAELGRVALERPSLDELFERATEAVAETLGTDYCKVLDRSEDGEELFLRSGVGWKPGYVGEASVPTDEGSQAGYTLLSSDPVVVDDLASETRFSGPDLLVDHGVVSGISTIIGPLDDPWGVIGTHDTERRSFTEYDVEFVQSVANILATAIDHRESERERRSQRERLSALNDLNSLVQQISESVVKESSRAEIERLVCEELAASDSYVFAWIGEADEASGTITMRSEVGVDDYLSNIAIDLDSDPGRSGPTAQAFLTGEMQVVQDVLENPSYESWRGHAERFGYRSSAAIPVSFDGTQYGVLNVYSERPGAFGREERTAFSRLGTIVGHALRSVERDRRLRESEQRYRTLAENIPNGAVALVDTDLTYLLAAGSNFDEVDVDPSDVEGRHVDEISFVPAVVRDRVNEALRAALEGETTTLRVEVDDRVYEHRTVPVRDDGDEIRAVMSLSQDITERVRREEELEHERERLELMNRLIRHNLLNSLNVVDARLELVEDGVEESVAEHLETARKRTHSMVELVQTIRSLMNAIVETDEVDLEPLSLDEAVRSKLSDTRELFPEAELTYEGPSDVDVCANELLDEVIENLLVNAVQHNDKPTPRVTVDADVGPETVTLSVADNGPGVDPDLEAEIFDKGTKGFESPGTGFGLHLVREIIDAYGGDVSVSNRDPEGAVFRVTLSRPTEES